MTTRKRLFVRSHDQADASRGFLANPIAPRIPDVAVYGGIGRPNVFPPPGRGTVVAVDALNLLEGDQVTLYWQDPVTPVESRAVPPNLNTSLIFDVPADALRRFPPFPPEGPTTGDNAQVEVWYTIYRAFPEELFTSDKAFVTVDWLVPGDPDPDPTTPYVNENLAPLVIPAPVPTGQDLILSIPRWKNAARGDRLNLAWGATQFLAATLADSLGEAGPALIVTVPWIVIDNAGDNIVATYYVLDAVSNHSLWAPSVVPDVETGDRLPAPTILGLNDYDELDADELAGGDASVEVRYPGALAGDRITLTWTGQTREGIPLPAFYLETTLPTPPTAKHTFRIPFAQIVPLIDGRARVSYTTVPAGGTPVRRSSSATARVVGTAIALPAPTVREASGGTLDPSGSATVIVRTDYAFMRPTDRIHLVWQGRTAGNELVTEQQDKRASEAVGDELAYTIPPAKIAVLAGGTVQVSYSVLTAEGITILSDALSLVVDEPGDVDIPLPPPGVDGAVGGILDVADIGTVVIVRVPPNPGFQPGDRVDVAWFGAPGDGTYIGNASKPADPGGVSFELPLRVVLANIGRAVTVQYAYFRGDARLSDARQLMIVDSGSLPAPSVDEASTGSLDPLALAGPFTVRTPASADLVATDSVTATVRGADGSGSTTTAAQAGAAGMTFGLPVGSLLPHLGKPVDVFYTRSRAGTFSASDLLRLDVADIGGGDTRLPTPRVTQASGGVLDLSTFTGGATVTVAAWPLIAIGQIASVGYLADGTPTVLRDGVAVSASELTAGLTVAMPRAALEKLADGTALIVYVEVMFGAGAATRFPNYVVVLKKAVDDVLPSPVLLEAGADDYLSQPEYYRQSTFRIRVPRYPAMEASDTVRTTWETPYGRYDSDIRTVGTVGTMDFPVIRPAVLDAIGVAGDISYTVKKGAADSRRSAIRSIKVQGQSMILPAPTINAALTEVTVSYPGMGRNQQVAVRWFGVTTEETAEQDVVDGKPLTFRIPAAWAAANRGKHVVVNYHVGLPPGQDTQFSRALRLTP